MDAFGQVEPMAAVRQRLSRINDRMWALRPARIFYQDWTGGFAAIGLAQSAPNVPTWWGAVCPLFSVAEA